MEQLSGLDAMFIHAEESGMPMHISSFSIYDPAQTGKGAVAFADVQAVFETMVAEVGVMRSKLVKPPFNLDQPYWVPDEDFDISAHLHRTSLSAPGDWHELSKLIGHWHSQPLKPGIPLWEAYVVDGIDKAINASKGSFGVFLKVHHSIMDGATGMAIFSSLHTITPNAEPALNLPQSAVDGGQASMVRMLSGAYVNNIRRSFKLAALLAEVVPIYRRMRQGVDEDKIKFLESKPHTRFNSAISAQRSVDRLVIDFESVRKIKNLVPGATVNDVALCIVGGALRKYLQSHKELPESTMVATVPINVREENDQNNHGNILSVMNVALRSDIKDPLRRLRAVHEASVQGKEFAGALGHGLLNKLCDVVYSGLASWIMDKFNHSGVLSLLPPANHTIVSNVPGIPIPFYFAGCKMVDSFGLGPLIPGTALFHTVSSSYQTMSISVTVCSEIMPDLDFYISCLASSFDELNALAANSKQAGSSRQKTAAKKSVAKKAATKKAATKKPAAKKPAAKKTAAKKAASRSRRALAKKPAAAAGNATRT